MQATAAKEAVSAGQQAKVSYGAELVERLVQVNHAHALNLHALYGYLSGQTEAISVGHRRTPRARTLAVGTVVPTASTQIFSAAAAFVLKYLLDTALCGILKRNDTVISVSTAAAFVLKCLLALTACRVW
jgi:hypothetical protein